MLTALGGFCSMLTLKDRSWHAAPLGQFVTKAKNGLRPPGDAHMSSTVAPGGGFSTCATTALGRFCSMPMPGGRSWQDGSLKTRSVIAIPMPLLALNMSCLESWAVPLPVISNTHQVISTSWPHRHLGHSVCLEHVLP